MVSATINVKTGDCILLQSYDEIGPGFPRYTGDELIERARVSGTLDYYDPDSSTRTPSPRL